MTELWDIYDSDKHRTGRTMERDDWTMQDGDYHLTVIGAVRRPDGRFLITQRKLDKSWAPGAWEVSGGACLSGEEPDDAIRREIREETGLDVTSAEGGYVFTYRRDNPDERNNYFVDVYLFTLEFEDEDLSLQEEEVEGYRLATVEEIRKLSADDGFLHFKSIERIFN